MTYPFKMGKARQGNYIFIAHFNSSKLKVIHIKIQKSTCIENLVIEIQLNSYIKKHELWILSVSGYKTLITRLTSCLNRTSAFSIVHPNEQMPFTTACASFTFSAHNCDPAPSCRNTVEIQKYLHGASAFTTWPVWTRFYKTCWSAFFSMYILFEN